MTNPIKVLEGFTHEERQMFLRFVYGQSRLPYNPADFTQKFELLSAPYATRGGANPDASTRFFLYSLTRFAFSCTAKHGSLFIAILAALPKSHTCFFSLELPPYTTQVPAHRHAPHPCFFSRVHIPLRLRVCAPLCQCSNFKTGEDG
jgi:hypothetical protein